MKVRRSIAVLLGAGVVSAATHVAGLTTAWSEPDIEIEGGAPVTVARLGDSFRDVAIGELSAQDPKETEQTDPVEDVQTPIDQQNLSERIEPEQNPALATDTLTNPVQPDQPSNSENLAASNIAEPVQPTQLPSPPETNENADQARRVAADTQVARLAPQSLASSDVAVPTVQSVLPKQSQKLRPIKPIETTTRQPLETPTKTTPLTLQAEPNADETAPQLSKRPRKRPREIVKATPKPQPERAAKPKNSKPKPKPKRVAKAAPKGNGQTAERAGSAQGTATAKASQAGKKPGKKAKKSGNASVSNYPGQVMRKIQRRKPRTNIRGTAVVSFSIAANGGLARLTLAQSSGSAALDKLALAAVQRAAPFPKPPAGAQRSFRLPVKGR